MKSIVTKILIFAYFFVGLVPYFGSVDKLATQWLYLSILNVISFIYILKKSNFIYIDIKKSFPFKLIFLFLLASLLSFINTINAIESFIYLTRLLTLLTMFYFILCLINNESIKLLLLIPLLLFCLEFLSFINDFLILDKTNLFTSRLRIKGFTGNVNIASFSILYKIPFIFYFALTQKNTLIKVFLSFLSISTFIFLLLINSRAAIVTSLLVLILFISYSLIFNRKYLSYLLLILISSLSFYYYSFSNSKSQGFFINRFGDDLSSSVDNRANMFKAAISHISEFPFFGSGLGTWRLYSILPNQLNNINYVVPYHVHNDFLEITAETGLFSGIIFFSFFLFSIYFLVKRFFETKQFLLFIIITSLLIYFIDSLFNFPFSRPIQVSFLVFLFAFTYKLKYCNR